MDEMNRALDKLQSLASVNGTYGSRVTAERKYGEAYQTLVRQGARPQIRRKYRL